MPETPRAKTHSLVSELAQQAWKEKGKQSSAQAWWETPRIGSVCCPREESGRICAWEGKWWLDTITGKQIYIPKAKNIPTPERHKPCSVSAVATHPQAAAHSPCCNPALRLISKEQSYLQQFLKHCCEAFLLPKEGTRHLISGSWKQFWTPTVPLPFTEGRAPGWTLLWGQPVMQCWEGSYGRRRHRTGFPRYSSHAHCQPSPELLPAPSAAAAKGTSGFEDGPHTATEHFPGKHPLFTKMSAACLAGETLPLNISL